MAQEFRIKIKPTVDRTDIGGFIAEMKRAASGTVTPIATLASAQSGQRGAGSPARTATRDLATVQGQLESVVQDAISRGVVSGRGAKDLEAAVGVIMADLRRGVQAALRRAGVDIGKSDLGASGGTEYVKTVRLAQGQADAAARAARDAAAATAAEKLDKRVEAALPRGVKTQVDADLAYSKQVKKGIADTERAAEAALIARTSAISFLSVERT